MMWIMTCKSTLDDDTTCGHVWRIPAEQVKGGLRCPHCLRWKVTGIPAPEEEAKAELEEERPATTPLNGEEPPLGNCEQDRPW